MNKETANKLIQAYAIGCLEDEELNSLKDYLSARGDFDWELLGEFQSLLALLPITLNIEKPPLQAKDKVARKLYRLKEEIRSRQTPAEKKITETEMKPAEAEGEKPGEITEPVKDEKIKTVEKTEDTSGSKKPAETIIAPHEREIEEKSFDVTDKAEKPTDKQTDTLEIKQRPVPSGKQRETQLRGRKTKKISEASPTSGRAKKPYTEKHIAESITPAKQSNLTLILSSVFFAVLFIALIYTYLQLSSGINNLQDELAGVKKEVAGLSTQVTANKEIQNILKSDNVSIVNLSGTNLNPNGSGKLMIDHTGNKAVLFLNNLPALGSNRDYQLWINVSGEYYSLKVFSSGAQKNYITLSVPTLSSQSESRFLVTEETAGGTEKPSRRVYLEGSWR